MKMNYNKMGMESFLSIKDNALALVLKTRLGTTPKQPIRYLRISHRTL